MNKIMIVDDEPSVRATLKILLTKKGFEVSEATNADEAWNKIRIKKPDLILLDVMMPGMKPVDFIKRIKDNAMLKTIKIIYVTAVMGAKESTKDQEGVVATIEKPFKNEILLAEINKALGK